MATLLEEPMKTGSDSMGFEARLLGLRLQEHLAPVEIYGHYFHARADGYHAAKLSTTLRRSVLAPHPGDEGEGRPSVPEHGGI